MNVLLIVIGTAIMVSALAGMVLDFCYRRLRSRILLWRPQQRSSVLLAWALAPVGCGFLSAMLLLSPVLWQNLNLPTGHCHDHAERLPHICLSNPFLSGMDFPAWQILPILSLLVCGLFIAQRHFSRLASTLEKATIRHGAGYNLIGGNRLFAATTGFWVPQIFISRTLVRKLSKDQLEVVLAHEQAHAQRRDPLRQYLGKMFSCFYFPGTRRQLISDMKLAAEQACDDTAALQVNDRLLVAETILLVERMMNKAQHSFAPNLATFVHNNSVQRIESLLTENNYQHSGIVGWFIIPPTLVIAPLVMPGPFHSLVEQIILS